MRTGTIELRSGTWKWVELELKSVPDWETAQRALHFEDPRESRNEMQRAIALDWDFDEKEIPVIAERPDWRRVADEDEVVWIVEPHERPPHALGVGKDLGHLPQQVTYRAKGEDGGLADLPEGMMLGKVTNGELLKAIGAAR